MQEDLRPVRCAAAVGAAAVGARRRVRRSQRREQKEEVQEMRKEKGGNVQVEQHVQGQVQEDLLPLPHLKKAENHDTRSRTPTSLGPQHCGFS